MKSYEENSIENAFDTKLQFSKGKTSGETSESTCNGSTTRGHEGHFFVEKEMVKEVDVQVTSGRAKILV